MAITGTFVADFASFYDAVQRAEVSLKSFEGNSNKVESALTRMTTSFSGQKVIQDATLMAQAVERVGGVSALTEKELARVTATVAEASAKMRAMGLEVPASFERIAAATTTAEAATSRWGGAVSAASGVLGSFGVVASIAGLVAMGKALFVDADALERLHDESGISVEGLQAMRIAGDDAGVSLETMTKSVTMLQKRLGGDDASANKALQDLGLSLEQFKSLDGAQQMEALSTAIATIHDPLRVAADLSALFGRSWADTLPALKRGFAEVADGTVQMSTLSVKALDDWGDAVVRFWRATKATLGESLADILTLSTSGWRQYESVVAAATDQAVKAAPSFAQVIPPGLPKDLDEINAKFEADAAAIADMTKAAKEADAELARMAGITTHLMGGDDIKRANDYMKALADVSDVSVLTADRQKEINTALNKALDAYHVLGQIGPIDMLRVEAATRNAFGGMNEFLKLGEKVRDEIYPPLAQNAETFAQAAARSFVVIGESAEQTRKIYEAAATSLETGFTQIVQSSDDAAAHVVKTWGQAMDAVRAGQGTLTGTILSGPLTDETRQATQAAYDQGRYYGPVLNWSQSNPRGTGPDWVALGYRALGGPVSAGQPYIVGERGPELFIPSTAGQVRANGAGGVTFNISVTQPLGTPDAIARVVGQAVMAQLRGQGWRVPATL